MIKMLIAYKTYDKCYEQGYGVTACCIFFFSPLNCLGSLSSLFVHDCFAKLDCTSYTSGCSIAFA